MSQISNDWLTVLKDEFNKDYFKKKNNFEI